MTTPSTKLEIADYACRMDEQDQAVKGARTRLDAELLIARTMRREYQRMLTERLAYDRDHRPFDGEI